MRSVTSCGVTVMPRTLASLAQQPEQDDAVEQAAIDRVALGRRHRAAGPRLGVLDGALELVAADRLAIDLGEHLRQHRRHRLRRFRSGLRARGRGGLGRAGGLSRRLGRRRVPAAAAGVAAVAAVV